MTEEIVNPENEELESQVETPEKQNGDEKKFSQAELTRMIQTRVKKEKDTAKKAVDELTAQLSEKDETISSFEKVLNELMSERLADYPEEIRELLLEKPVLERIEWMEKHKLSKKSFPQRKQAEGNLEEKKTPPKPKAFM